MIKRWIAVPMLALTAIFAGCEDDNDDILEPEPFAEFVGDFEAQTFEFVADTDPGLTTDLVAEGATFEFSVEDDGDVFTTLTRPTGEVITTQGVLEERNGLFIFRETTGQLREFDLRLQGDNLFLERTDARFDFDDDGILDDADFEAQLFPVTL